MEALQPFALLIAVPLQGFDQCGVFAVAERPYYPKTELASSDRSALVVKHSAKTALASNGSMVKGDASLRNDEPIADALVISLGVIVRDELADGRS